MADAGIMEQLAKLDLAVQEMERRHAQGDAPIASLEAIKIFLDDVRLRLWGLLRAASGEDGIQFQERFRIRRAIELLGRLTADLRSGGLDSSIPELADLRRAVLELGSAIDNSR
jgi:hypothetical protein